MLEKYISEGSDGDKVIMEKLYYYFFTITCSFVKEYSLHSGSR